MPDGVAKIAYSRKEIHRVLGISEAQLRNWERQSLIPVLKHFGFSDLLALKTLQKLRNSKLSVPRIRAVLNALRQKIAGVEDPLKELKILTEGKAVIVVMDGHRMEPLSGQLLLDFDQEELKRLVEFPQGAAKNSRAAKERVREAERWFEQGLELEQTGAPLEEILAAYRKAVELDPNAAGAMVNLGTVYYHLRNWTEAKIWYRKALSVDSSYALAHFNLGNLYDERGDRTLAILHYESAIRLNPRYADAHYNLALLHQNAGETMKAVHHWKIYLKLDPGSSWATIARRELDKLRRSTLISGMRYGVPETEAGQLP